MSRKRSIPSGVQMMAWERTIRYIGWGAGDTLIPVLIMSLTGTFAGAGLINASYDIVLLLALPLCGVLAEKFPGKWLVIAGLLLYPLVGIFYFLAGATGLLLFVVFARTSNGVTWGLESVGIDTYFRRLTPGGSLASSFGWLDTLSEVAWMAAALSGIWLIHYFSIGDLLFLIAPFSLLAIPFALAARTDHPALGKSKKPLALRDSYRIALDEWRAWAGDLRLLAGLLLFTETVSVLVDFFIPIDIYLDSHNLALVILFTVVSGIPPAFGYLLGRVADAREKHRVAAVACVAMALILFALSLPLPYLFTILAGLGLGIVIELLAVLRQALATRLTPAERWGRLDSVFQIVGCVADIGAPPLLGAALDLAGLPAVAAVLAAIALLLALVFILNTHDRPLKLPGGAWLHLPPPERAL